MSKPITDQQIEQAVNLRHSPPHTSCNQCKYFSHTKHEIYPDHPGYNNCRLLTSKNYTKPPPPNHTCDNFQPNER